MSLHYCTETPYISQANTTEGLVGSKHGDHTFVWFFIVISQPNTLILLQSGSEKQNQSPQNINSPDSFWRIFISVGTYRKPTAWLFGDD